MEQSQRLFPEEITCPHCGSLLLLDDAERGESRILCPECNVNISPEQLGDETNASIQEVAQVSGRMKKANLVLLFLLVLSFGQAFADPKFWTSGWTPLIFIGVILVPGTLLLASYVRQRARARSVSRKLAVIYNCAAALLLGLHGVTMIVSKMHPVALAIREQFVSLIIAVLAALNAWRLMVQGVRFDGINVPPDYISAGKTSSKPAFVSLSTGLVSVFYMFFTPIEPFTVKRWLIAGLGGVFIIFFTSLSVVAIFYGHRALRELHSNPDLRGRWAADVGQVAGYLGLLWGVGSVLLWLFYRP